MQNATKIALIAISLACLGFIAAFNARWVRSGFSPWWTTYIMSLFTSSIFAYQLRANILPITSIAVFQHFFFHSSWYLTAIFFLHEPMTIFKGIGLTLAFIGMIMMSL